MADGISLIAYRLSKAGTLEMEPRPYRQPTDLDRMRALLVEGRKANNGTYYVHVGDVNWWLFYPNQEQEFPERIFLWEDGERVIGWALFSPRDRAFDVYVHPAERGSERAEGMYRWAANGMETLARKLGHPDIRMFWVFEDDAVLTALLQKHGFARSGDDMAYLARSLADPIPAPPLPVGYTVRPVAGEREVQKRATASHGAFGSKLPFEQYWPRYLSFMQSPAYEAGRDMVVVAPGERFAAFCIYWLDPVNRVGLFEPVGTHPDFQRQGLGKALLLESLRRMRERQTNTAIVCAEVGNARALRLYESVGFHAANRLCMYTRKV
jgi:ribosomal protein S18 acetylase RimI-like enzyme